MTTTAVLMIAPYMQFFDNSGVVPLAGGLLYTYAAGTTTPLVTYTDATAATPAANPIVLDSAGRCQVWGVGSYKFIVKDSLGNPIGDPADNVISYTIPSTIGSPLFDIFSGDGSTTVFTLDQSGGTIAKELLVWIDAGDGKGLNLQAPTTYTVNGTAFTFNSAPTSGTNNIYIVAPNTIANSAAASATAAAGSATSAAADAVATAADKVACDADVVSAAASAAAAASSAATASGMPCAVAGGTSNAITATYSPAITLVDQRIVAFVASAANTTTTPTFAPNSLTAHTITKKGGQALVAGDIPGALAVCLLEYNLANTRWELMNPGAVVAPPSQEYVLLGSATASTSTELDFVSLMSSAYSSYKFVIRDLILSSSQSVLLGTSSNNGSTYVSVQSYSREAASFGGSSAPSVTGGSNPSPLTANTQGVATSGELNIYNALGVQPLITCTIGNNSSSWWRSTIVDTTGSMNACRFYVTTGNITSGSILMYGVKNT